MTAGRFCLDADAAASRPSPFPSLESPIESMLLIFSRDLPSTEFLLHTRRIKTFED
jgi:hypothetical protein